MAARPADLSEVLSDLSVSRLEVGGYFGQKYLQLFIFAGIFVQ
jgi:hypothetical protein